MTDQTEVATIENDIDESTGVILSAPSSKVMNLSGKGLFFVNLRADCGDGCITVAGVQKVSESQDKENHGDFFDFALCGYRRIKEKFAFSDNDDWGQVIGVSKKGCPVAFLIKTYSISNFEAFAQAAIINGTPPLGKMVRMEFKGAEKTIIDNSGKSVKTKFFTGVFAFIEEKTEFDDVCKTIVERVMDGDVSIFPNPS